MDTSRCVCCRIRFGADFGAESVGSAKSQRVLFDQHVVERPAAWGEVLSLIQQGGELCRYCFVRMTTGRLNAEETAT